eukprot:14758318-Alexandrium_andersonii.AAC.1
MSSGATFATSSLTSPRYRRTVPGEGGHSLAGRERDGLERRAASAHTHLQERAQHNRGDRWDNFTCQLGCT